VVIPKRTSLKSIRQLLDQHRPWVEKHLKQYQQEASNTPKYAQKIHLRSINQYWTIYYEKCDAPLKLQADPLQNKLTIVGDQADHLIACQEILEKWIREQATNYLPFHLRHLSQMHQLPFSGSSIRNQKTRWGSCSAHKNINLNYRLILFPEALCEHIILHELCHTIHLNHSQDFWKLLKNIDPDCTANKRALKSANTYIPIWLRN